MGGQGLALDGLVHQSQALQGPDRLLQRGAPAQRPGQQTPRMDRRLSRPGGLVIHRVLRVVEQGPHEPGGIYAVHQDGFPKAQHRHARVPVPAPEALLRRVERGRAGDPGGNRQDPVGAQVPELVVGPPQQVAAVLRLPGKAAASKIHGVIPPFLLACRFGL